jgi:hypothetical protein
MDFNTNYFSNRLINMKHCSNCDGIRSPEHLYCYPGSICKHRYCLKCNKKNKGECLLCKKQKTTTYCNEYIKQLILKYNELNLNETTIELNSVKERYHLY